MNRIIRISLISIITIALISGTTWYVMHSSQAAPQELFLTGKIAHNPITKQITTSGNLKIKNTVKVGSLVSGTISQLLAEENATVKKGELLAIIDNGKGDSSLLGAKGHVMSAHARYQAAQKKRDRYHVLFEQGHISDEEFSEYDRLFLEAKGALISAQAELSYADQEFTNTQITAPETGVVINVGVKKGERVTTDLKATVISIIAPDLAQMEAELDIDESDVSNLKSGQPVEFTVDTYPNRTFSGTIKSISYAPFYEKNNVFYGAKFDVDNSEQLFRPGMNIQATVTTAEIDNASTISSHAFYIDSKSVKSIANMLKAQYKPLDSTTKEAFIKKHPGSTRFIWTTRDVPRIFEEKAVVVGVSDLQQTEVISGLNDNDEYLIDVIEESDMDSFYKQMFKGGL